MELLAVIELTAYEDLQLALQRGLILGCCVRLQHLQNPQRHGLGEVQFSAAWVLWGAKVLLKAPRLYLVWSRLHLRCPSCDE